MGKRFSKLTRPELRSVAIGESLSEHGITFHRNASADGVYSINVMVYRQRIRRVIGRESEGVIPTASISDSVGIPKSVLI